MALMLLQVLVLGVFAAAAGDVPLTWYGSSRTLVPCVLPDAARAQHRRPLPLHGADDAPPYSWRRDGVNYTHKILANGTLELRKREAVDGVYQCAVALRRGVLLGYPVRLTAAHLDKFSKHPVNTTARRGQPVALPCVITSEPPAIVSWLKDDQDLPADDRYYLLKNQLLIIDVSDNDAGVYRCIATNTFLNKSRTSHGGRLHVTAPEPQVLELLPTFEDQELMVAEGGGVVLPCPVAGWPRPEPEVTWEQSSGGQVRPLSGGPVRPLSGGPVLALTDLGAAQDGVYTCRVPGRPDLQKTYNVTITQPVNITLPPVSKEVMRAGTIRFNCTATGWPKPNVTWYKDGAPLAIGGTIGLLKAFSKEDRIEQLVINSITSKDAGVYQCFASNNVSIASAWAVLTVTGPVAPAPQDISCAPVGAKEVAVRWAPVPTDVLAYTVHTTAQEPGVPDTPLGQPVRDTHTVINVPIPLAPYRFQVRAYIQSAKGAATDISDFVVCQGQGVPVNLSKLNTTVLVSWEKFARQAPGVVEWVVQSRTAEESPVSNVTLDGAVTNYTLDLPEDGDLQVRVLGSRSRPWLPQNLTAVPWRSVGLSTGDLRATPRNLMVTAVGPRGFTVRWETDDLSPRKYRFLVCAAKIDDPATSEDICQKSDAHAATMENLQPGSEYEVRVETRIQDLEPAEAVLPYHVFTQPEEATAINYKYFNATTVRVSWKGPGRYTVRHRQQLPPPMGDVMGTVETDGNTVLLTGIDPNADTYVEVISQDHAATQEITIPPQLSVIDAKDLSYVYTSSGITVSWVGAGPRVVKFAQNITQPLEKWIAVNVTGSHVQLAGLDRRLPTYVTVSAAGSGPVLTVPPAPPAPSVAVGEPALTTYLILCTYVTVSAAGSGPVLTVPPAPPAPSVAVGEPALTTYLILCTYVTVSAAGSGPVLTVPPAPPAPSVAVGEPALTTYLILCTYVTVSAAGSGPVLTVPPAPPAPSVAVGEPALTTYLILCTYVTVSAAGSGPVLTVPPAPPAPSVAVGEPALTTYLILCTYVTVSAAGSGPVLTVPPAPPAPSVAVGEPALTAYLILCTYVTVSAAGSGPVLTVPPAPPAPSVAVGEPALTTYLILCTYVTVSAAGSGPVLTVPPAPPAPSVAVGEPALTTYLILCTYVTVSAAGSGPVLTVPPAPPAPSVAVGEPALTTYLILCTYVTVSAAGSGPVLTVPPAPPAPSVAVGEPALTTYLILCTYVTVSAAGSGPVLTVPPAPPAPSVAVGEPALTAYLILCTYVTVSAAGSGPVLTVPPAPPAPSVAVGEPALTAYLILCTYVTVSAAGSGPVLTVPPAPPAPSVAVGVGLGCAACVLLLLAAAALLVWRRRKMAASPVRTRRRTMSPIEGHQGESSEMKNIGGRLANGGAAGEPLLNGHVHITENPTSKTPNGKMKKARYEPFDVSRHDADTTLETVLDADTSASYLLDTSASYLLDTSASYLLDTSRRPELDMSRSSRDLSANNSFNKLPDDNMNSEITRSSEFTLDNSKIQPTLQPNG